MTEIFIKLLNMSIAASWLVLCVIALRLVFKKAPRWTMCVLWAMVAIRLLCPFSIESALSLVPSAETVPETIVHSESPEIHTGIEYFNSTVNPIISEGLAPIPESRVNPMEIIGAAASVIWVAGMAAMAVYATVSYVKIRKRAGEALEEEKGVWICDRVDTPFILGVFRPRIILPSDLPEGDRQYVIAHEKAHIKRLDHIWKPLGFLLLTVYWFNPLLWVAYILLCRDIETACDEKVIKSFGEEAKAPYANALINCSASKRLITACPLAFGETGVKSRIRSVLSYKKPAFWIIAVAVVASVVLAVCFLTDPSSVKSKNMQEFLEEQIIEHHRGGYSDGEFCCTEFKVLGSEKHKEDITVYMLVLYQEYDKINGKVEHVSGAYIPTAVTVRDENGELSLVEYWEPRDGTYYANDIKDRFPLLSAIKALNGDHYIEKLEANCQKKAEKYFSKSSDKSDNGGQTVGPQVESDVKIYVCHDSPERVFSPNVTLSEPEGTFHFSFSAFSSEYIAGRYERTDAELILRTDGDNSKVYVFTLGEDDTLIFDAERSAKIPSYRYGEGKEPQCPVPDGAVFSRSDDYWTSQLPVIDTIDHDLNGDGYPENITLTHGPTSGVNSLMIHVADVKNEKEYSEWWGCDFESASLSRDGDRLAVVFERRLANVDGLWAFETVCTYVSIENDELVFETKDSSTGSVFLKYYDLEKNKQSVSQSEINAVCEKMYEMYGRTDPDTGFDYYCVVDCAFDVDGVKYYLIYWKWLVEDENGEYHHASTITNFVMSEDLSDLHGAFIEDDGTLIIYNNLS